MPAEQRDKILAALKNNKIKATADPEQPDRIWILNNENEKLKVLRGSALDGIDVKPREAQPPPKKSPLETLAKRGQLEAYKHHGFWHCIDTLRTSMEVQCTQSYRNSAGPIPIASSTGSDRIPLVAIRYSLQ